MSEKKFEVYGLKVNQITEALGMDVAQLSSISHVTPRKTTVWDLTV